MIRVARLDDAPALAAIYAPYVLDTTITFEEVPPSAEEMAVRLTTTLKTLPWLVAVIEGEVVGYAYAAPHRARAGYRWSVDTGIYIDSRCIGKGHGRALYEALLPILVQQRYTAAYAGVALPNDASVGLHEAMGFTPIGVYRGVGSKFGKWVDVGWWTRDLAPRTSPPEEPIPFPDLA